MFGKRRDRYVAIAFDLVPLDKSALMQLIEQGIYIRSVIIGQHLCLDPPWTIFQPTRAIGDAPESLKQQSP